jgi:hypothetical protein
MLMFECNNGAAFPSGELRSFLGFLSGPTELVGVTDSIMLQRWKYGESFVMLHIKSGYIYYAIFVVGIVCRY